MLKLFKRGNNISPIKERSNNIFGLHNTLRMKNAKQGSYISTRRDPNDVGNNTSSIIFHARPNINENYMSHPGELPVPLGNNEGNGRYARTYVRNTGILNKITDRRPNGQSIWSAYQYFDMPKLIENYAAPVHVEDSHEGKEAFADENIFLLSGHGYDASLNDQERYFLKKNQYAMIPGKCGTSLTVKSIEHTKGFYNYNKPIAIFNKETENSFALLNFTKLSRNNLNRTMSRKLSNYKHYRPKMDESNAEERISVPPLHIQPFGASVEKNTVRIPVSGLLQKSNPYHYIVKPRANEIDKYIKTIYLDKADDIKIPLGRVASVGGKANEVLIALKQSLGGSILTFDDIVNLTIIKLYESLDGDLIEKMRSIQEDPMYERYKQSITVDDMIDLILPVKFFFDFLDSKTDKPYLVIFSVCRSVSGASAENIMRQRRMSREGGARITRKRRSRK
jgi:hypothetical protein